MRVEIGWSDGSFEVEENDGDYGHGPRRWERERMIEGIDWGGQMKRYRKWNGQWVEYWKMKEREREF